MENQIPIDQELQFIKQQLADIYSLILNKDATKPEPDIINLDEACKILKRKKQTIYGWTSKNKIPHIKKGGLFFSRKKLYEFLEGGVKKTKDEWLNS